MSSGVKESISRQLFDEEQEDIQQNNNSNITMQSDDQQHDDGGGVNNNDVSHKNDNTSTTNQHIEQPMESQQDDGLDSNELTSTLLGGDINMNQEQSPTQRQGEEQEDSSSSESDGEESSSSSSSEEEEESDNDEGLSEYELLRKRNIKRNQKRLRKLGLLTDNNTSALSSAAAKSNGGESNSNNKPKQVRKQQAPIQRRSLPRRKCAKLSLLLSNNNNENSTSNDINNNNKTNGYESDESSIAPSPIKITRILHPQPHQKKSLEQQEETKLKQYKRTRRMKRGRPKREEYEYVCNESCQLCGGGWVLDSNDDEDVEEETRLIRCKDCRGAFHLKCMLANDNDNSEDGDEGRDGGGDKDDSGEEEDRKMPAASNDTNASADDNNGMPLEVVQEQETRDPKRCYKCEEEYKRRKEQEQQHTSTTTQTSLSILEATLSNNQTVRVRITPEPLLEANVNGKDVSVSIVLNSGGTNGGSNNEANNTKKYPKESNGLTCPHCSKEFVSQGGLDYHIEKKVCQRRAQRKKHVTWGIPLEEKEEEGNTDDPTTKKIRKIISKALADTEYAKLQDYSCAALRNHLPKDADKIVRLGGVQMLTAAMEHHPQRPMIQAEAICTLAELAWTLPQSCADICRGCLDLVVAAMEHHTSVLEMGCGLMRALSYDAECCVQLKKKKAVSVVVESIKHNPRKVDVMIEGSMFLQNMMVVSANTTLTFILGTTKRRRQMNDNNSEQVDLLPTLVTAIQTNSDNADLAFAIFGLLSNIAIHNEGSVSLSGLDVHTLATEAIRIHSSHSDLHDVVSTLLQNVELEATAG